MESQVDMNSGGAFWDGLGAIGAVIPGLTGVMGALGGLFGGKSKRQRIEEDYNRRAAGMLATNQERVNNINPQAQADAATMGLSRAQSGAVGAALNATMGQIASAGDFQSGLGKAIAGSQASQAAAAPTAGQIAGIQSGVTGQQLAQANESTSIANQMAGLSNQVSYMTEMERNPLMDILRGAQAGTNAGTNIFALLNQAKGRSRMQKPEQVYNGFAAGAGPYTGG